MAVSLFAWTAGGAEPVASANAPMNFISESSSAGSGAPATNPNSLQPVVEFPLGSISYVEFAGVLPLSYVAGTSINLILIWRSTQNTGACRFGGQMKSISDGEANNRTWGDAVEGNFTTAATVGQLEYSTILFDSSSELDNCNPGEYFRVRIYREEADGGDTLNASAFLVALKMETV